MTMNQTPKAVSKPSNAELEGLLVGTYAIEYVVRRWRIPPELLTERGTLNVEEDNHE